jgi:hypothetical protein
MRSKHAGLTGTVSRALVAAVVLMMAFAVSVSAMPAGPLAPDIPGFPQFFRGNVRTDRGVLLPGALVTAKAVSGGWTGMSTTTADALSRYGYNPDFSIPGYVDTPASGAKRGDKIAFWVQGVQALLYDVSTNITSTTYVFNPDNSPVNLDLIVPLNYTITATAGPNGSISPSGQVSVDYGFDQTFTFTPNACYLIDDVKVDGVSNPAAVAAGSYTFTNVKANHTIDVTFKIKTFTITPTAGPGGSISPNTPQVVTCGSSKTFTFTPNIEYLIDDVKVDAVSNPAAVAAGSYAFTNVQADHTIGVTFKIKTFTITPTAGPNGSISPNTPQTVIYGNSQTFTFTPDTGYLIEDVKVDGVSDPAAVAAGAYTFTNVKADHTIGVTFKIKTFTITPSAGANGSISPNTPQIVDYGSSKTFTFTPNACYLIDDVKVDGVSNSAAVAAGSYTFADVTADHTIAVTFKIKTFTITPTAGPNGSIIPNTPQTVNCGASQTFTFTPDTGYLIEDVKVDGVSNLAAVAAGSYAFSDVAADHGLEVTFKQKPVVAHLLYLPIIAQ